MQKDGLKINKAMKEDKLNKEQTQAQVIEFLKRENELLKQRMSQFATAEQLKVVDFKFKVLELSRFFTEDVVDKASKDIADVLFGPEDYEPTNESRCDDAEFTEANQ